MLQAPLEKNIGVRLTVADREKLRELCTATQRPPGQLVRLLIRMAQASDIPTGLRFVPAPDLEGCEV